MKSKFVFIITAVLFMFSFSFSFASDASCVVSANVGIKNSDAQTAGDVTRLQNFLTSNGYLAEGNISGYFGELTLAAVKAFQAANGIDTTGFVGPSSRAKISSVGCGEVLGAFSDYLSSLRSAATFKTVDKGTLKLSYDNANKESSLVGKQQVRVVAGSQDVLINYIPLRLKGNVGNISTPHGITPNDIDTTFVGVSNSVKETVTVDAGDDDTQVDVWRVKAGKEAVFETTITLRPKDMYAGTYYVYAPDAIILKGDAFESVNVQSVNSATVTIVGEKATFIPTTPPAATASSSISVLTPNGGEKYKIGDTLNIKYSGKNFPLASYLSVFLTDGPTPIDVKAMSNAISSPSTSGEVSFVIPESGCSGDMCYPAFKPGNYKVNLLLTDKRPVGNIPNPPAVKTLADDKSNATFAIASSTVPRPAATSSQNYLISTSLTANRDDYYAGDSVALTYAVKNNSQSPIAYSFSSGCQVEVSGPFEDDEICSQSLTSFSIPAGQTKTFTINKDIEADAAKKTYSVTAMLDGYSKTKATANIRVVATSTTLVTFPRNLTLGSTGNDVAALQTILIDKGFLVMPAGVAKGYFGLATMNAVIKMQRAAGISPAFGYVGPATRAYLEDQPMAGGVLGASTSSGSPVTTIKEKKKKSKPAVSVSPSSVSQTLSVGQEYSQTLFVENIEGFSSTSSLSSTWSVPKKGLPAGITLEEKGEFWYVLTGAATEPGKYKTKIKVTVKSGKEKDTVSIPVVIEVKPAAPSAFLFARDLTLGSTGPDVVVLQDLLVFKGFLVMPTGTAKGYFGASTQKALAKYQKSVGLSPADGYFGPVTRAYVNAHETPVEEAAVLEVPAESFVDEGSGAYGYGDDDTLRWYTFSFKATAIGEDAVISSSSIKVFGEGAGTFLRSYEVSSTAEESSPGVFTVEEGESETFTVTVTLYDVSVSGVYRVGLDSIGATDVDNASFRTSYRTIYSH